ncbi:polyprenyl synthetase family protein [Solirubrobacter ginsenosidimutans]|uniref:Polyprenyl synthetase family protein n=1 Tax=Solirubrobacter ginsenosidimutans TaxID=490573 RepID=A0A9X3MZ69_9ACTN|nr:polyprenyl synthetase family protein [Solirubrobacter ginsenosidimutans]MDA0165696.1 polyprenyl synthetase family protein [Solirubrobacter ginsenosidimutans]
MHPAASQDVPERAAGFPDDLTLLVNDYLAQLRFAREPGVSGLQEAMHYSLLAPGKRVRPVLALATARAIGHDPREVLPLAAALELIHTFTLVHDDLPALDDDDLRRGQPTAHVRFGEDVAILAADALFAEAFRLVLSEQRGEPAHVLAALAALTDATGVNGLAGGQYIDVRGLAGARSVGLRCLHRLKTGALMRASVESVLLVHGFKGVALDEFRKFADELGLLFQIVDDILDVTADASELGKDTGTDARHGKVTYVSRFGLPWAQSLAEQTHAAARAALARAVPDGAAELEAITDFFLDRTS